MKSLKCAAFTDALIPVEVESTFVRGLPGFNIVGLAGATIKESESRVKAALVSLNFKFPASKIIINLSPSDTPKNGSHFDLAIALLIALQKERIDGDFFVFGELGLDGSLKSTASLFSILLFLSTKVRRAKILVPQSIALKACTIPNYDVYVVDSLSDAVRFFLDEEFAASRLMRETHPLFKNVVEIDGQAYVPNRDFSLDFKDVKGQKRAKRASLIAACGMHNILFEGSPGCGKSMCAKRIARILPPQSLGEVLLSCAYESLNNKDVDFSALRPFRSPHHTSTRSSIFGGGSSGAKIGEVALANGGELFFDELPHFGKQILESLREPLEDNRILISRVNSKVEYQTKFIFVAAQNPCPCGNLFSKNLTCTCSLNDIRRYKNTISAPLLDRIDIYVAMDETGADDRSDVCSEEMADAVLRAFRAQKARGQSELNAKLRDEDTEKFCVCESAAREILQTAITRYDLSQRGVNKTLKLARTIADLAGAEIIAKAHILEALSFRIRSEFEKIFFSTEELDARASAKFGLGEQILMENAAGRIEGEIRKRLKKGSRILALCGGGNNGADAMAALRKLSGDFSCTALCVLQNRSVAGKFQAEAARVAGVRLIDIASAKDDCKHAGSASSKDACAHESVEGFSLNGISSCEGEPRGEGKSLSGANISGGGDKLSAKFTGAKFEIAGHGDECGNLGSECGEPSVLHDEITSADCIIDGIFGSGLNKALSSEICEILSLANSAKSLKIAVDIPSGIDKNGCVLGGAFCADLTIAMGALKLALFSDAAKDQVGRIKVANLGISRSNSEGRSEYFLLQKSDLKLPLRRKQNTNKGDFGHTYVVSGQMSGAAQMAALAAHAIGSGLVSVVSDEPLNLSPILMQKSSFDAARVVVCGCGLGERKIDLAALRDKSCVIDADLCYEREILSLLNANSNLIITPHPKEFCSLLKIASIADLSVSELQERRFELARAWSEKFSGVLVLKGANTLIAQAGIIYVCDKGSAVLAKGGSGDVLAGLIGGLLAQSYSPLQASICGVLAHALAARAFAKNSYALNPLDLIEEVKWL